MAIVALIRIFVKPLYKIHHIRNDFPILKKRQNGKPFIYFDNAATTQKPRQIVEKLKEHYATSHANVHRGVYRVAEEATRRFEEAREKVARFRQHDFAQDFPRWSRHDDRRELAWSTGVAPDPNRLER